VSTSVGQLSSLTIIVPPANYADTAIINCTPDGLRFCGVMTVINSSRSAGITWDAEHGITTLPFNRPITTTASCQGISPDGGRVLMHVTPQGESGIRGTYYCGPPAADMSSGLTLSSGNIEVYDMSADATVVTGGIFTGAFQSGLAWDDGFVWKPFESRLIHLDTQPARMGVGARAYPDVWLNDRGLIVGDVVSRQGSSLPVIWDSEGRYQRTLMDPDGQVARGSAWCASRNGRIIVGTGYNAVAGGEICRWVDDGPRETVLPASSSFDLWPNAVADHGHMIIMTSQKPYTVWTQEYGLDSFNSFFARFGLAAPTGWNFYGIGCISADGSVLGGSISRVDPSTQARQFRGFIARTTYHPCFADFNQDGGVDGADIEAFFAVWASGSPDADINQDGGVDGSDVAAFFQQWEAGGCV
jgi:hypothetical protein